MNELSLFTGAGGILAGRRLGWRPVCAVEIDEYARAVLLARQDDRSLPPFPIWDDVRTFAGEPWRGFVDVVSGGFPCQDISQAGKREGISGKRSGLWVEMARIIGEVGPEYVFVENAADLNRRGLDVVLADLSALGFDAEWGVLGAADVGAPHRRHRTWVVGRSDANGRRLQELRQSQHPGLEGSSWAVVDGLRPAGRGARSPADPSGERTQVPAGREHATIQVLGSDSASRSDSDGNWWAVESPVGRVVDGLARRVDRLRCLGNGQVPHAAEAAFLELSRRLMQKETLCENE